MRSLTLNTRPKLKLLMLPNEHTALTRPGYRVVRDGGTRLLTCSGVCTLLTSQDVTLLMSMHMFSTFYCSSKMQDCALGLDGLQQLQVGLRCKK